LSEAEVVLGMLDSTAGSEELAAQLALLGQHWDGSSQKLILLLNKADLVEDSAYNKNVSVINKFVSSLDYKVDILNIAAKKGQGLDALKQRLLALEKDLIPNQDSTFVTNVRHYDALRQASSALQDCRTSLSRGIPSDLVAEDLRRALSAINAILGTDLLDPEVILHSIFRNHCIGK
jgi:tRNA modification GTPase